MESRNLLPTGAQMGLFALGAGIFAAVVYLITYDLWYPVFNLVNTSTDTSRLVMDLFIAGMHMFVIFALVPVVAGALFIVAFYRKVNVTGLIFASTLMTIVMGTIFFVFTTFTVSPENLSLFLTQWATLSTPGIWDEMVADFIRPMLTQIVEYIVWSSAGAYIAYLMIYQDWVNPRKSNLKYNGTVGMALVSAAAFVPPAITYVATVL